MAYKHQINSYRDGGEWICWCDGLVDEITLKVVADIREQGFKAKREKNRVFVLASEADQIESRINW